MENPDSILVAASTNELEFTSRYADPNHPANNGSLISLVTGGNVNPPSVGSGGRRDGVGGLGGLLSDGCIGGGGGGSVLDQEEG